MCPIGADHSRGRGPCRARPEVSVLPDPVAPLQSEHGPAPGPRSLRGRSVWPIARALFLLTPLGLAGCGGAEPGAPLRVAAASDLQAVLPVLAARFRAEAGVEVVATFGSSGNLARQIRQGAPFDLFLSANRQYIEDLAAEGVIRPDSVDPYAVGVLALAVHEAVSAPIATLDDLRRPEVRRVALANPEFAPYGVAARQALERSGLWDDLGPKLVLADSVRHALQFVQSGNAEVGLVALSNARDAPRVRATPIDESRHEPITQVLGVVAGAAREADARAFARFLLGPDGQAILARDGFRPVEP